MPGEAFDGVDFFGVFMEVVYDIRKETASGGKHAIGDVEGKLSVGFGKMSGNFQPKRYNESVK